MTTFNTAAAPQAPAYVAKLWQMEVSPEDVINFKFKDNDAAAEMQAELKSDSDPMIAAVTRTEAVVSVHYTDRNAVPHIAKAISQAYGIELI